MDKVKEVLKCQEIIIKILKIVLLDNKKINI
jgi:hypothetical protein